MSINTFTWMGRKLRNGEPCHHPGCLSHVSHPCEGCGRIGGRTRQRTIEEIARSLTESIVFLWGKENEFDAANVRSVAMRALRQALPLELEALGFEQEQSQ